MSFKKPSPKPLSRGLSIAEFMSVADMSELNKIQELWAQLDTNRKGLLSVTDLQEVMKTYGVEASFEDVSEIIIELDSDGDGKISFKDFAKGVMQKQKLSSSTPSLSFCPSKPPSSPSKAYPPPTKASLSSSPSSTLPLSSPSKAHPPPTKAPLSSSPSSSLPLSHSAVGKISTGSPKMQRKEIEQSNSSEKPPGSPSKFLRSPSVVQFVLHLTGPQLSEMQTLFNHYDTDKDGKIDHKSVQTIVREINPSIDSQDIQELLRSIDTDRDGLVNFKEFIDGMVLAYRTNRRHAEKVAKEIHEDGLKTKKQMKQTIIKLQEEISVKDMTIADLQKQVHELQKENARLKLSRI